MFRIEQKTSSKKHFFFESEMNFMKDLNYLYRKLFLFGSVGILLSTSILSTPAIAQEARDKKFPVPNSIDIMTPHKVGLFTNYASIAPTCKVARSDNPLA